MPRGWSITNGATRASARPPESLVANWDGTDLAGRTLLVVADEGYGDFIQFCRYIPLAARQGGVVVRAPLGLLRLML